MAYIKSCIERMGYNDIRVIIDQNRTIQRLKENGLAIETRPVISTLVRYREQWEAEKTEWEVKRTRFL